MSDRRAGRHAKDAQILALLQGGLDDAAVCDRLNVGERHVSRARAAAGIAPAPPSPAKFRPRSSQELAIWQLLEEGHSNREIGRRTGASTDWIAGLRRKGKFGHSKDAEIRALLPTHSTAAIANKLQVGRDVVRRVRRLTAEQAASTHIRECTTCTTATRPPEMCPDGQRLALAAVNPPYHRPHHTRHHGRGRRPRERSDLMPTLDTRAEGETRWDA